MLRSGRDHSKNATQHVRLPVDCCYLLLTSSRNKIRRLQRRYKKSVSTPASLHLDDALLLCKCRNSTSEDSEKRQQYSQYSQTPLLPPLLFGRSLRLRTVPPDRWIFSPSYGSLHRPIHDCRIKLPTEIFPCAHKPGAFLDILGIALPTKGCSITFPDNLDTHWSTNITSGRRPTYGSCVQWSRNATLARR